LKKFHDFLKWLGAHFARFIAQRSDKNAKYKIKLEFGVTLGRENFLGSKKELAYLLGVK